MRVALIRSARLCLDIQYYIWHADLSGSLLLEEIEAAADRGVTVRLILDDNGIGGMDATLASLAGHPNIAVRLFNPFTLRFPKALNWLFAFTRLNRRMHAKSLTADARLTIVGGRNVGDEYFDAKREGLFDDLDVLATGPVVAQVASVFERHWHDPRSREAEDVLACISPKAKRKATHAVGERTQSAAAERYREAVRALSLVEDIRDGGLTLLDAPALVSANMPSPTPALRSTGIAALLPAGLPKPRCELVLISGYFVPTQQGCADLAELVRAGTRVRVLTNSFAATDVGVVHAGYAPCRATLLRSGVELFEMPAPDDEPKTARKFMRPGSTGARHQSGRSLHAKIYIADRRSIYVGSANFDPRSAHLNTELGIVIDSPALAERMIQAFDRAAESGYRLGLDQRGRLEWTDLRDDEPQPERGEPGTTMISRALVGLLSRLPLEGQL